MNALIQSIIAGAAWLALFFSLTALVNKKIGRTVFSGIGILAAYPLFCFFQVFLVKALDVVHLLNSESFILIYFILLLGFSFYLIRFKSSSTAALSSHEPNDPLTQNLAYGTAGLFLLLFLPISLLIPVYFRDDLIYHMPMVANYYQNHTLADWATQSLRQVIRPYAIELQMLHLAFLSGSDAWMELPNVLALFISLIAAFEIAKLTLGRKDLAWLCVILVLTAHQILLTPAAAANDAPFMALTLCAFYWFLRILSNPSENKIFSLVLLSTSAALTIATKVLGICLFATLASVMILLIIFRRFPFKIFLGFLGFGLLFILILLGDVFRDNISRKVIWVGIELNEQCPPSFAILSSLKYYGYELGFKRFFSDSDRTYGASHYGYLYPFLFLFGSVRIAYELFRPKKNLSLPLWTLAALTLILFLSTAGFRGPQPYDQRYMIWMVPVLSILTLSYLRSFNAHLIRLFALISCFLAFFSFSQLYTQSALASMLNKSFHYLLKYHEPMRYVDLFPGNEWRLPSRKINNELQGYPVLEREAKASDWILYIGGAETLMYPAWGKKFSRTVHGVENLEDATKKINSGKYEFIIFERNAEEKLRSSTLKIAKEAHYHGIAKFPNRIIAKRA